MSDKELVDPKGKRTGNAICLKCDRPFWSTHKFNRICQTCTKTNNQYEIINDTYYGFGDGFWKRLNVQIVAQHLTVQTSF